MAKFHYWVSSDFHGFHKNMCYAESEWNDKETNCRKYDSVNKMNRAVMDSINRKVKKKDILIHCGDFTFGEPLNIWKFRRELKVEKIIQINGNHDQYIKKNTAVQVGYSYMGCRRLFHEVHDKPYRMFYEGYYFVFSHYPPQECDEIKREDTIWIHGHCHHKSDGDEIHQKYNVFDVSWDGKPYTLDYFIDIVNKRKVDECKIRIQDLRIGNYVILDNENVHGVTGQLMIVEGIREITRRSKSSNWRDVIPYENKKVWYKISLKHIVLRKAYKYAQFIQYIKPVLLTEEFLIKSGFKFIDGEFFIPDRDTVKVSFIEGSMWVVYNGNAVKKVMFVHELQNILYDLIGYEFEITI